MPKEYGGFFNPDDDSSNLQPINKGVTVSDFFGQVKNTSIENISLDELLPFSGNLPFRPYSDDALKSLADDIREHGLLHPIVVRKVVTDDFEEKFEILSGHNRAAAAKQAGLSAILCNIVDIVDNDIAKLIAINCNLEQRHDLFPSEKAFAYKYRLEVMKKQGKRTDLIENDSETLTDGTLCGIRTKLDSGEEIAKTETDSRRKIFEFIRLTYLKDQLLNMVDSGTLPFYAGVDISFLNDSDQEMLFEVLSDISAPKVTLDMSKLLKELSKNRLLDEQSIRDILANCYGRNKRTEKPAVYSVRATKDFGKYLKKATKKRPLTLKESEELLEVLKRAATDYINDLEN
jgi:ParB family chromosome partitioning protein